MAINTHAPAAAKVTNGSTAAKLDELKNLHLFGKKAGIQDRMVFTERLALMIDTGSPLFDSLGTIKKGITNPLVEESIDRIENSIDNGGSFALALSQEQELFDAPYVNLVAAGEKGGFLPQVLKQLHTADKKRSELSSVVRNALFYPAFLLFFSVAVVVFVLLVVFPKFEEMFAGLGDNLPLSTRVLMQASHFMMEYWVAIAVATVALLSILVIWSKKPAAKAWSDQMKLRIPIIRDIVIQYYLLQTLRVLSLSIGNGVNVLDAIRGCRDIIDNSIYQRFLDETAEAVEYGAGVSAGFNASPLIPDMVKQMVTTGDQTGNLATVMSRIAEHYEVDLNKRIVAMSKLAEPIMLLIMGAFVGLMVSSLILPIFQLSRAVN